MELQKDIDVAADVRAALARNRMKQSELAAATGINSSTLSRRLSGESDFTVPELRSIGQVLGMSIIQLVPALAEERAS
jgi:transcriptional regulator with XRE-family HTH domain